MTPTEFLDKILARWRPKVLQLQRYSAEEA